MEVALRTAKHPKRCVVCGSQATLRCFRCHRLYCREHANFCQHTIAAYPAHHIEQAIREATCGVCGRVVIDEDGGRYVSLDACRSCGVLICDLCIGHVETRPGPHGFVVRVWCEDCAPSASRRQTPEGLWRRQLGLAL
jgi:hypothetical protein